MNGPSGTPANSVVPNSDDPLQTAQVSAPAPAAAYAHQDQWCGPSDTTERAIVHSPDDPLLTGQASGIFVVRAYLIQLAEVLRHYTGISTIPRSYINLRDCTEGYRLLTYLESLNSFSLDIANTLAEIETETDPERRAALEEDAIKEISKRHVEKLTMGRQYISGRQRQVTVFMFTKYF